MKLSDVLTPTPAGLHCPPGGFFIDPMRKADRAVVTHAHSDHARSGHGAVLATRETLDLMAIRLGAKFAGARVAAEPGNATRVGDVDVTLFPAGHVLGSAQILIEYNGFRAVVSGDYKRAKDATCAAFEPVLCDGFVTEATFGLPVFRGMDAEAEIARLLESVSVFPDRAHLVGAYSLGKAQRLMGLLRRAGWDRPIFLHPALEKTTRYHAAAGAPIGAFETLRPDDPRDRAGEIVLCPPNAASGDWGAQFADPVVAFASGWTRVRRLAGRGGCQLPLAVSDHADWDELRRTIVETGCRELWVTHGAEAALVAWARGRGLEARPLGVVGYGEGGE